MLGNKRSEFVRMPTSPEEGEVSFDCQLAGDDHRIIQC